MTSATATRTDIPGYVAGRWTIDPVHSDISFTARHMMVSKVRGHFRDFTGEIVTADDPLASTVTASIQVGSIETNNEMRDNHIRSADFFEAENNPEATYRSSRILEKDGEFVLDGELTLRGVTRSVPLRLEINGFGPDAQGGYRAGFSARGTINRKDFGVNFSAVANGVVVVSDNIDLLLEIEAILQPAA